VLEPRGENKNVLFVNASGYFMRDNRTRKNVLIKIDEIAAIYRNEKDMEEISTFIDRDRIEQKNYNLLADQYVLSKEEKAVYQILSEVHTAPLSKIANIIRPQNIVDEKDTEGDLYKEVSMGDIPNCGYIFTHSREKYFKENVSRAERNRLRRYDVLLSTTGTVGKVGIVPENIGDNYIAGQNLQILRFTDKLQAIAIYMFFKSEIGQAILRSLTVDSTIPRVQSEALKSIRVPRLSKEELEEKEKMFDREIELYRKIESIKEEIDGIHKRFIPNLSIADVKS
jgi:type I restriction enzyme M protein